MQKIYLFKFPSKISSEIRKFLLYMNPAHVFHIYNTKIQPFSPQSFRLISCLNDKGKIVGVQLHVRDIFISL